MKDLLKEQPLLKQGIITTPEQIDYHSFKELEWAFLTYRNRFPDNPIRLFILGNGGDVAYTMSLLDLIDIIGNVHGVIIGEALSCHGVLWAGCSQRFITRNAALGIHQVMIQLDDARYMRDDLSVSVHDISRDSTRSATLYATACGDDAYDVVYWSKMMQDYKYHTLKITADEIVNKYKMGEYYDSEMHRAYYAGDRQPVTSG